MGTIRKATIKAALFLIQLYQWLISPFLGQCCRFHPTCSNYAMDAFKQHGCLYALLLTVKRILRCHPFAKGGVDFVPEP